ncbi:MAG: hypothetical protein ACRC9H_05350, partial [Aeromonas veronii]
AEADIGRHIGTHAEQFAHIRQTPFMIWLVSCSTSTLVRQTAGEGAIPSPVTGNNRPMANHATGVAFVW